ncbi:MAG: tetratricopeptide repeat protein [Elusimicrobiota bacterium]
MPRLELTHEAMRHYYRGRVFESTGEINIAIDEYKKAVELGADYADIHNSLGRAYAKKGMFKEATEEFKYALQLNPHYLDAQRNLNEMETRLAIIQREIAQEMPLPIPVKKVAVKSEVFPHLKFAVAGAAAVVLIVLSITGIPKIIRSFSSDTRILTFEIPSENVTAMCLDKKGSLWVCDWLKQEVYNLKQEGNLLIVTNKFVMTVVPAGITAGDDYLWTLDIWAKKINRHVYNDKLTIISSYNSPGTSPGALCWDGKTLWSADTASKKIYRHNVNDPGLTPVVSFNSPCERQIGFFYDGKFFWSVDGMAMKVYKHSRDMSVIKSYNLDITGKKMSGVLITREYVWIAFEGENKLIRYPRNTLLN